MVRSVLYSSDSGKRFISDPGMIANIVDILGIGGSLDSDREYALRIINDPEDPRVYCSQLS